MNLGNKIRELRRARNLTQEQLAASLNISAQAVSKWEMCASYPDMALLPTLAAFFNVSIDELFDFDVRNIDKEIEEIRLEYNKYFWNNFEKAEQILLDGLKLYPASVQLKTELFELYAYNTDRGEEIINKANQDAATIRSDAQTKIADLTAQLASLRKQTAEYYDSLKKITDAQTASMEQMKKLL